MVARDNCQLCLALLQAVESFWPLAQGYSAHYRKRTYNNKPNDMRALRGALDAITLESSQKSKAFAPKSRVNELLVNRLAAKIAACSRAPEKKAVDSTKRIVDPPLNKVEKVEESKPKSGGIKMLENTVPKPPAETSKKQFTSVEPSSRTKNVSADTDKN